MPQEAEIVEGDLTDLEFLEKFFTVEDGTDTIVQHISNTASA